MPLAPMGAVVFCEATVEETDDELKDKFTALTAEFDSKLESRSAQLETSVSNRQISASMSAKHQAFIARVIAVGVDCKEISVGEYAILPPRQGSMITVIDEDTGEALRVYSIFESAILARWFD